MNVIEQMSNMELLANRQIARWLSDNETDKDLRLKIVALLNKLEKQLEKNVTALALKVAADPLNI
jgi:UDP-N-acetylglucosamine:LPS N-acetylglucosamine transferase